MTCVTCGADLDPTETRCPVCGEATVSERPTGGPAFAGVAVDTAVADGPPPPPATETTSTVSEGSGSSAPGGASSAGASSGSGASGHPADGGPAGPPPAGGSPGGQPPPSGPPAGGWPAGAAPRPHPSGLSSEVRGWAIGAHIGALVLGTLSAAALGFLAPLLVWLLKKDEHPFIDHHGKEALNFQLTVILALVVGAVLAIPAMLFGVVTLGIGFVVIAVALVGAMAVWIIFPIIGAVKASNGEGWRYPLTIRFVA